RHCRLPPESRALRVPDGGLRMPFVIAVLVFAVVTLAIFAAVFLFDQRKAQARILRDEVLSRIPAFDTLLRRSERVSLLQKMLAQGNVNVRAGNFLMLCGVSALVFAAVAFIAGGNMIFGWVGALLGFF